MVIARALILEPKLVICDEPVAALDVAIAAQVVSLLRELQERLNVAYLFISHDLKIVRRLAHEVAVMYLGRIVEQGDPIRLFDTPSHPYTRALVSAVPTPERRLRDRVLLAGERITYRAQSAAYPLELQTSQIIVEMLREVGLNVELEIKENWDQVYKTPFESVIWNESTLFAWPDPSGGLIRLYGPSGQFQRAPFPSPCHAMIAR